MLDKEGLRHETLSGLISQRKGLENTKTIVEKDLQTIIRAIDEVARQEGILSNNPDELLPGQDIKFTNKRKLGNTEMISGHRLVNGCQEEVRAYYCPSCGGWVWGEPDKLSLIHI